MNIRVLRKLAWFALPLATLCVSCGEDDDTSWKDRLEAIEQSNAALESTLSTVSSQISEGEFVTKVEFNDAGQLVITTNKTTMPPIEIPSEAVQLEVVPFIDEDGKLNVKTVCNGEECPLPTPIDLGEENAIPEFKLAEKDGEIILTMDGEVVEGSGVTMPTGVDVSDVTLKVTTDGRLVMTYGDGQEAEVKLPEGAAYELPAIELKPNGEGVVELWIDGKKVDDATIELPAVEKDKFATVVDNGDKFTISTYNGTTGAVETYDLTKVPVAISSISLIGKYVNDAGVPQETTPVKYLAYTECVDGEHAAFQMLPAVSHTDYQVNPEGIALDGALSTVVYDIYDAGDLSTVGTSDHNQLSFTVYGKPVYDKENGVMTVAHKIDWVDLATVSNDNYAGSAYWTFMSGEDSGDTDPIATLKMQDPNSEDKAYVYAEDHGLFKVPYVDPCIRQLDQVALGEHAIDHYKYRHTPDIFNSGSDFVIKCGETYNLSDLVDGIAHRVTGYTQQEETDNYDTKQAFEWFSQIGIASEDYAFEWAFATADEVGDDEHYENQSKYWSLDSDGTFTAKAEYFTPYNKVWVKVRMLDKEDDDAGQHIMLNTAGEYPNDRYFHDVERYDDISLGSDVGEEHLEKHEGLRQGEACEWMFFEIIACSDFASEPIAVPYTEKMVMSYYDYYMKDELSVNNEHRGVAVSLNDRQTTGLFDFEEVFTATELNALQFTDIYGVDGDRNNLLLPRSIVLTAPGGVETVFDLITDSETSGSEDGYNLSRYNDYSAEVETQSTFPYEYGHIDDENDPTWTCHFEKQIVGEPEGAVAELDFICEREEDLNNSGTQNFKITLPTSIVDTPGEEKVYTLEFVFGAAEAAEVVVTTTLTVSRELVELPKHEDYWENGFTADAGTITQNGVMDYEDPKHFYFINDIVEQYQVRNFRRVAPSGEDMAMFPLEIPLQVEDQNTTYGVPSEDEFMEYVLVNGTADYLAAANGTSSSFNMSALDPSQDGFDITVYVDANDNGIADVTEIVGGSNQEVNGPALTASIYSDYSAYDLLVATANTWSDRYAKWITLTTLPYDPRDIALVDADDKELYYGTKKYGHDFFKPYLEGSAMVDYPGGLKYANVGKWKNNAYQSEVYDMIAEVAHTTTWQEKLELDKDEVTVKFEDPFADVEIFAAGATAPSTTFTLSEELTGTKYPLNGMVQLKARRGGIKSEEFPIIARYNNETYPGYYTPSWSSYFIPVGGDDSRPVYGGSQPNLPTVEDIMVARRDGVTEPIVTFAFNVDHPETKEYTIDSGKVEFVVEIDDKDTEATEDDEEIVKLKYDPNMTKLVAGENVEIQVVACIDHNWAAGADGLTEDAWGKLRSKVLTFIIEPSK